MEQGNLFPQPCQALTDAELGAVLRLAVARAGRLSRLADLHLNSICVDHLVDELRGAGLDVVRRPAPRPTT